MRTRHVYALIHNTNKCADEIKHLCFFFMCLLYTIYRSYIFKITLYKKIYYVISYKLYCTRLIIERFRVQREAFPFRKLH